MKGIINALCLLIANINEHTLFKVAELFGLLEYIYGLTIRSLGILYKLIVSNHYHIKMHPILNLCNLRLDNFLGNIFMELQTKLLF